MTTSTITPATDQPETELFPVIGYCSDRFGMLHCIPCAKVSGADRTDQPITVAHLFDGEELCSCCREPMVPESQR